MARINSPASQESLELRYLIGERVSSKDVQTRVTDIFTALSTVEGKIDTVDLVVDAIKVKTDNLPANTASVLTSIEGKVDTVDTVVDAIKAVTDLLPNGGALTSIAQASALATVDTVVDGIKAVTDLLPDGGALTSLAQDSTVAKASALATVDTVVDGIKAVTDLLPDGGALTSLATSAALTTVSGKIDTLDTVVDGIQADLDNSTDGLGALKILIDSVQSTATAIQNNTRLTSSIPQEIQVPISGSIYTKFFINMYDSGGSKEDPDSNDIAIILTNVAGTDLTTTRLFKDGSGTALDASTEFSGSKKMERDSLGRYFVFYKNTSTDTVDTLNFQLKYNEGTVLNGSDRSMRVVEQLGTGAATVANQQQILSDLAVVDGNVDAIKAVTDLLPDGGALTSLAQDSTVAKASALATVDTVVDGIKAVTDLLPDAGALTSIAKASDLATVDTVVDAIKVKTDGLPASTATELSDIKGAGFAATDALKNINDNVKALHAQKGVRATKNSTSIAQGASATVDLSTAEGWNVINAVLLRIDVTISTGASTSFDVEVFEDSGLTKSLMLIQDVGASGLFLGSLNELFTNQDGTVGKHIYVKITNVTDAGSTTFTVKVRALSLPDALV